MLSLIIDTPIIDLVFFLSNLPIIGIIDDSGEVALLLIDNSEGIIFIDSEDEKDRVASITTDEQLSSISSLEW